MSDLGRIYAVQALRAFVYGFGSVTLGASLARAGLSPLRVGLVFGAMLAGSALASLVFSRRADRLGRRRVYLALLVAMGAAGTVFALTSSFPLLILAALTGALSVDVVEAGPFTSIEQAMLPQAAEAAGQSPARVFGRYNAVAAFVGAAGALSAGGPEALRAATGSAPPGQRFLLAFPVAAAIGLVLARGLSKGVEAPTVRRPGRTLQDSRGPVLRLAALFALDSFAGGFIVQTYLVYWFTEVHGASTALMGVVFAAVGVIQAGSFVLAPWIAQRVGLLNTMVFTHLPSNVLLILIPLAPSLGWALAILLVRFPLSQMDVPTRQAYLALLAGPEERAAAASVTNGTRTLVRPIAAPFAGAAVGSSVPGLPFFAAGALKIVYDLILYVWFRRIPVDEERLPKPLRPGS